MAHMTFNAGEELALKLSKLAEHQDAIAKKAIYEGAKLVADQIRENLNAVLSGNSSGELERSLGVTPIKMDNNGNWNAKIGFDGYDKNEVPNQLKARILESGSSKQRKKPFVRPAVNKVKKSVQEKMNTVVDEEIKKIMR